MTMHFLDRAAIDLLAEVYLAAGVVNLTGGRFVRRLFNRWHYRRNFHRLVGALELAAAILLSYPQTRVFGLVMAGIIGFFSVVTLLNHRQYAWSVPAMLLFAAIIPAALAQS
jgi:hypothetical protein